MEILTHVQQNSYIIELNGTLNSNNAHVVKYALAEALQLKPKEVMVDCENLDEISPRSLKYLRNTVRILQQNQIGLVLISVNNRLNEVFNCLGLQNVTRHITSTSLISSSDHCDIYFRKI